MLRGGAGAVCSRETEFWEMSQSKTGTIIHKVHPSMASQFLKSSLFCPQLWCELGVPKQMDSTVGNSTPVSRETFRQKSATPLIEILVHQINLSPPQTPGLVRLESMQRLQRYRISCIGTHIWSLQGHPRNAPFWPPPKIRLCSITSSCESSFSNGKRQDWSKFGEVSLSCQIGAKWCQNGWWHAHRPPTSHSLTQPDCLRCVYVAQGWFWTWGEQGGGKSNWPCSGGSSGGDDLWQSSKDDGKLVNPEMMPTPCSVSCVYRSINLLLSYYWAWCE